MCFRPLLVAIAAVADSTGAHALALDALLGAVPFAAVSAITAFGDYLDARDDSVVALQALLWAAVLALLVLSCAMRSDAIQGVPPLAVSSLVAALGLLGVKGLSRPRRTPAASPSFAPQSRSRHFPGGTLTRGSVPAGLKVALKIQGGWPVARAASSEVLPRAGPGAGMA